MAAKIGGEETDLENPALKYPAGETRPYNPGPELPPELNFSEGLAPPNEGGGGGGGGVAATNSQRRGAVSLDRNY